VRLRSEDPGVWSQSSGCWNAVRAAGSPRKIEGFDERVNVWFDTGESRVGADIWFEDKETSYSSDVRSGYDEDQPPARLVEEPSEDDVDSDAAVIAAGDDAD